MKQLRKVKDRFGFLEIVVVATLFVALGGVSYAAIELPAKSVGTEHLKGNVVNSAKVRNGSLLVRDIKKGQLKHLKLVAAQVGPTGATGSVGTTGEPGPQGPAGEAGPIGPEGQRGDPRDGPTGNQGPEGVQGSEGDPGAAGTDGADASGYIVMSARSAVGNAEQYMAISGQSTAGARYTVEMIPPFEAPMEASDLQVVLDNPPGGNATRTFSLMLNFGPHRRPLLSCDISGNGTQCHRRQSSETIPALNTYGWNRMSIQSSAAGNPMDTNVMTSFKLAPLAD